MDSKKTDELLDLVRSLRDEVQSLRDRIDAIEKDRARPPVDDELIAILSSAIAAYLGVKPKIRQVRLISSESWAIQGRTTIQASHALQR